MRKRSTLDAPAAKVKALALNSTASRSAVLVQYLFGYIERLPQMPEEKRNFFMKGKNRLYFRIKTMKISSYSAAGNW